MGYETTASGSHTTAMGLGTTTQFGVIAQEVREVLSELVIDGTDGILSVSYPNLTAVLIEAVKEQQAQIDERDRKIAKLDAQLARMEKLLTEQ